MGGLIPYVNVGDDWVMLEMQQERNKLKKQLLVFLFYQWVCLKVSCVPGELLEILTVEVFCAKVGLLSDKGLKEALILISNIWRDLNL